MDEFAKEEQSQFLKCCIYFDSWNRNTPEFESPYNVGIHINDELKTYTNYNTVIGNFLKYMKST